MDFRLSPEFLIPQLAMLTFTKWYSHSKLCHSKASYVSQFLGVEGGCKLRCTDLQSFLREFGASWKVGWHVGIAWFLLANG